MSPAPPATPPTASAQPIPWLGLMAVLLGTFLSTLNGRLSSFGLADVRAAVHAGFDEGAWITTAQTTAQMLVVPIAVWLGGLYGSRRILICAALAFAVISLLKGLADDLSMMLLLQFLGGVASGFFIPLTMSFVLKTMPPKVWPYGIALYALNLEFSLNISASVEGFYGDHLSWRWIFWQSVPISLAMAACLYFGSKPEPKNTALKGFDLFGMATCGGGLALIYAALDQGNRLDWMNSGLIWGLMIAGVVILLAFFLHERRTAHPFLDLSIVLTPPFPAVVLLISILRLTILSTAYLIPTFLGSVRGFRALEMGPTLLWIATPQLLICAIAGAVMRRVDARLSASLGFICICAACLIAAHGLTVVWGSDQFMASHLLQAVGQSFALTGIVFYSVQNIRPAWALTLGAVSQIGRLVGGEVGQAFIVTFVRVRSQIVDNLLGLHVQSGGAMTDQRLRAYAAATARAGSPETATVRGSSVLANVIRSAATTQAVIDAYVTIAVFAALGILLLALQKRPPSGPASPNLLSANWGRSE